jgi:uncharacterized protein (DUF952 family)
MPIIYHVTTQAAWNEALQQNKYEAASLETELFIHCSEEHQVAGVLQRYFSGQTDLVKLVIDTDKLTHPLVMEWSDSASDTFPHIYGPINIDAVQDVVII